MFEIVFLGTSASAPSIDRGLSSSLVLYRDQRFMCDCGEGTQRQLLRSGMGFRKLNKVLITHGHLDHILGLGGLVSTFSRWESMEALEVYGGEWALRRIDDLMKVVIRGGEVDMTVDLKPIRSGVIWQDKTMAISAFPVVHRGPGCFGYVLAEKAKGPFLVERAEALGVPPGPCRRDLVNGQAITLGDGTVVEPDQVLGPATSGLKVVHVGDTGRTDNLVDVCRDADALVIEATYTSYESDMAARFGHLTAARAARLAVEANVKQLFLVHLSRRYSARDIRREAEAIFPDTIVPRDLDHYRITKTGAELVRE